MFRRSAAFLSSVLPSVVLIGCDAGEVGPTQSREGVFRYQTRMAAGTTLHVRTARGNIVVEPAADDTLRVRGDVTWRGFGEPLEGIELTGAEVADDVLICAIWGRTACSTENYDVNLSGRSRRTRVSFHIQVPAGVRLELVGLDGDITTASTAPVEVRNVNGDITVVTARGPVRAVTVNGDVDARMSSLAGTDSVVVKTLNGEAWAFLPEAADATVDAEIMNGEVVTDFPVLLQAAGGKRSLRGVLGAGTTPVVVRSMNGRSGVRRLDAQGRAYDLPR